jgi:putative tryptophan/tyrosine transport system substrate-binding protein
MLTRGDRLFRLVWLRAFVLALCLGALVAPFAAETQQAGKAYRIGMLETVSPALNIANLEAFRQGLRDLGYIEGQNVVIEYRSADGRPERFSELATELVGLKVDVIVTRGTPAVLAARRATETLPIVMAAIGEPLGHGIVTSLARPGGNVTGLSAFVTELTAKRVELLREIVPRLRRIAALLNMGNPTTRPQWREIETAARSFGIQAQLLDVRKSDAIEPAFEAAVKQRAAAMVVGIDAVTQANRRRIVELAVKHRLPAIYPSREFVDAGGLITYGVSYPDLYRRAAYYVDKILKGANPAELSVAQPTTLQLVINLNAARALGVTIPQSVLQRADQVIQ